MIGSLRGQILAKSPQELLLDVGGVGYRVTIPLSTYYKLQEPGATASLRIHTHVREDLLQLFGFLTRDEQDLFELLISVSGVGPKLAVNVLSGIEPPELAAALAGADVARLTRIPGVGRKTADRLVLELREKARALAAAAPAPATAGVPREDLVSALANLGYSRVEAEKALERTLREDSGGRFEDVLRRALRALSSGR